MRSFEMALTRAADRGGRANSDSRVSGTTGA